MKLTKAIFIAVALLTVFSLNSFAQTNLVTVTNVVTMTVTNVVTVTNTVTKLASPKPVVALPLTNAVIKYPWKSSITAGLTLTRGNSDTLLAQLKFTTDKKTPVNEYTFEGDASYGSASGVENNQIFHGYGQWNHLFSERLYSYLRLEGLHDGIAQVKYRATLTAGAGYYFVKEANTKLAGEIGPGLVLERVGTTDNTYATLRLAERFEHKFTPHHARIWQTVEVLPQVDKWSDYLVNFEIGAEAAIAQNLSLQVTLDDNYNSQPAAGRKRNDIRLVSGITYNF